jgi:hypothetical protein
MEADGSASSPMAGFRISGVELSGSAITVFVYVETQLRNYCQMCFHVYTQEKINVSYS